MAIAKNKTTMTNNEAKTVKTGFDFEATVVSQLKGETPTELAAEIKESALSAYQSLIPAQQGKSVQLRRNIKKAEEDLKLARINNARDITDATSYIENVRRAKDRLNDAKAALKDNDDFVAELKEELAYLA